MYKYKKTYFYTIKIILSKLSLHNKVMEKKSGP